MFNVKDYIKNKGIGFYFTVGIALFSVVTAIVYAACYTGTDSMSWIAFALLLVGVVGSAVLVVFKQYNWAPIAQAVLNFLAFLFFAYGIYYYVSVVMVGIDLTSFEPAFFVNIILFVINFGLSVANVFLRQIKNNAAKDQREQINGQKAV